MLLADGQTEITAYPFIPSHPSIHNIGFSVLNSSRQFKTVLDSTETKMIHYRDITDTIHMQLHCNNWTATITLQQCTVNCTATINKQMQRQMSERTHFFLGRAIAIFIIIVVNTILIINIILLNICLLSFWLVLSLHVKASIKVM